MANWLLEGAKDDQIDDLFGYACSKRTKEHLVDSVVNNQMWHPGGQWAPATQQGISEETIKAFDAL
jgi:hypothetical protein